jgi:glycosyltransferase involved in cell wall biosynthesis
MKLEILISTMDNKFQKREITPPSKYLVINQLTEKGEKGLAKSRNMAIESASNDICLISDDDLEYLESIEDNILNKFKEYQDADIITFCIKTPDNKPYKKYKDNIFWHTKRTIMSVSSVEIAFRLDSINRVNLRFDENFGLGSQFPTGEEIIFLSDALDNGLKILYVPIDIVIHPIESSGKNYHNINLIEAKGAMFYRLFGILGYVASGLFTLKKYKESPFSLIKFYQIMINGINKYRRVDEE